MEESTLKTVVIYTSDNDATELYDLLADLISQGNIAVVVDLQQAEDDYIASIREQIDTYIDESPECVEDSLILAPGKIYLVPPDRQATVEGQKLHVNRKTEKTRKEDGPVRSECTLDSKSVASRKKTGDSNSQRKDKNLAKFGRFVLENGNLQKVLNHATRLLRKEITVDYVALLKLKEGEQKVFLTSEYASSASKKGKLELMLSEGSLADYTFQKKSPVVSEDIAQDDRFSCDDILLQRGFKSLISVAVEGSEQIYGMLVVFAKERRTFTDHEINFVHNMANMLGYAEERIRMENKLNEIQSELQSKIQTEKELQRDILEVEKKERWRLGQYLHDETAQNLLSIKMLIELLAPKIEALDEEAKEQVEKIRRMIVRIEKNVRELSHFVLPIEADDKVIEAFDELLSQTESLYDVNCSFSSDSTVGEVNNPTVASSLYYITQEAIRNAINHGNADDIEVSITTTGDRHIELKVFDNGIGYQGQETQKGRGINIMRHRATLFGGSLEVKLADDKSGGTIVSCRIPLEANQQ